MEYFFALLVIFWILSQLFGQQSAEEGSQPPQPSERERERSRASSGEERSQSVQDAIREIEEQLRGGSRQESASEHSQHWEQRPSAGEPRSKSDTERQAPAPTSEQQRSATDRQKARSEQRTSKWRRSQIESPDVKDITFENEISTPPSFKDPGSRAPRKTRSDEPDMQARIHKRLASHEGRREAFLIKELLDEPRSQRPWPS